jgi:hypothetical protein
MLEILANTEMKMTELTKICPNWSFLDEMMVIGQVCDALACDPQIEYGTTGESRHSQ